MDGNKVNRVDLEHYKEIERQKDLEKKKKKLVKRLMLSSTGCLPFLFGIFALFLAALMVLGIISNDDSSNLSGRCIDVKSADEVCNSIDVADYGTMSVDEYVAGVVEHEFGSAPDEVLKAQAIAARSYGIAGAAKNANGSCSVGDTSEGFQTYSNSPSERSVNAANETSGMVMINENGNIARTEYSSNSLPAPYDSYGSMITMSERNLEIPRDWFSANKTCDSSTLNNPKKETDAYGRTVYGCGHGRGMGQIAAKYLANEKNYTYDQILEFFYGQDSEYKWSLASSKDAGSTCPSDKNGNLQTLDSYTLYHGKLKKLDYSLSDSDKKEINSFLKQEIEKAGHGTSEAVAAVGQALVFALEQKGVYLGYYWGGGHDDTSGVIGVSSKWGKNVGIAYTSNNNPTGPEYGMDCSGFVSWATRNACKSDFGAHVSGDWQSMGKKINSLSDAQPGDVLADSGHVQLVVKNNGDGSIIVAEETRSYGLIFNRVTSPNHPIYSMKDWYSKNCKK